MKRERSILVLFGIIVAICVGFWYINSDSHGASKTTNIVTTAQKANVSDNQERKQKSTDTPKDYAVQIYGAVKHPGVYTFSSAVRVCEVIEAAGGLLKTAEDSSVNQARFIEDGEQIHILTKKEARQNNQANQSESQPGVVKTDGGNKININTATKEELLQITGVGEAKATAIINYRTEHGNFSKIEDIMNISGIKSGVFNKIKDQITI